MRVFVALLSVAILVGGVGLRRRADVEGLTLEVDRLERAIAALPDEKREAVGELPREFLGPDVSRPALAERRVGAHQPGALLGVERLSTGAEAANEQKAFSRGRSSEDETPEFDVLTVRVPVRPRLCSWIECDGAVSVLVQFGDGSEVWLSEGESHRGYRLVHADRRAVVLHEPRWLRAVRLRPWSDR